MPGSRRRSRAFGASVFVARRALVGYTSASAPRLPRTTSRVNAIASERSGAGTWSILFRTTNTPRGDGAHLLEERTLPAWEIGERCRGHEDRHLPLGQHRPCRGRVVQMDALDPGRVRRENSVGESVTRVGEDNAVAGRTRSRVGGLRHVPSDGRRRDVLDAAVGERDLEMRLGPPPHAGHHRGQGDRSRREQVRAEQRVHERRLTALERTDDDDVEALLGELLRQRRDLRWPRRSRRGARRKRRDPRGLRSGSSAGPRTSAPPHAPTRSVGAISSRERLRGPHRVHRV